MPLVNKVFVDSGFTKDKSGYYYKTINEDCYIYGVINTAGRYYHDAFIVNPIIGIRHGELELIYGKITGLGIDSTVNLSLGYTMPQNKYIEWDFCTGSNMFEIAESIKQALIEYGIPYLIGTMDYWNLIKLYEKHGLAGQCYIIPIIYFMLGEEESGLKYLEESIDFYKKNPRSFTGYQDYLEYCVMFKKYYNVVG